MEVGYSKLEFDGNIFNKNEIFGLMEEHSELSKNFKFKKISINTRVKTFLFNIRPEKKELLDGLLMDFELPNNIYNKKLNVLSTGERIKILILKTCISNSSSILLNHIDTYLNYKDLNTILKALKKYIPKINKTIIFTSSNMDNIVTLCSKYIIIENNKIIFNDKHLDNLPVKTQIMDFVDKANQRGTKLLYYKDINDLLKAVYRSVKK